MSTNASICLLLNKLLFIEGLRTLSEFEIFEQGVTVTDSDGYDYIARTPSEKIIERLPDYISLIGLDNLEFDENTLPRCLFRKDELDITVSFSPWLQEAWGLDNQSKFIIIDLGFAENTNLWSLPIDHPSMPMLELISSKLQPILGWGSDGNLEPITNNATPKHAKPIWVKIISPMLIGRPLSTVVKQQLNLDDPKNGLFYCKNLGNEIYWIAAPGTFERLTEDSSRGNVPITQRNLLPKHIEAEKKMKEILKSIPTSILD
jgi:hypothetical protein